MPDPNQLPPVPYTEHHFQKVKDVGIAWDGTRVWVCINGQATFRAKVHQGRLMAEFHKPEAVYGGR